MPEAISSLPPATAPIRHTSDTDGAPDTHEISFNELWENKKEGLSFSDVLDIVNPLQHIPVISTVYRMITGDEISQGARMVGGTLYGGPLGLMGAGIVAAIEETTGKKIEGHIASIFESSPTKAEQVAAAQSEHKGATGSAVLDVVSPPARTPTADQFSSLPPHKRGTPAHTGPTQLSQSDGQKILQFLSDRREATQQASPNTVSKKNQLSEAILKAQRAQTDLLLANIGGTTASAANSAQSDENVSASKQSHSPATPVTPFFKPHPYMLPRGAPPALVAKAMENALERYNALNAQRATPLPVPDDETR